MRNDIKTMLVRFSDATRSKGPTSRHIEWICCWSGPDQGLSGSDAVDSKKAYFFKKCTCKF